MDILPKSNNYQILFFWRRSLIDFFINPTFVSMFLIFDF